VFCEPYPIGGLVAGEQKSWLEPKITLKGVPNSWEAMEKIVTSTHRDHFC
jgi:hypothetical protein